MRKKITSVLIIALCMLMAVPWGVFAQAVNAENGDLKTQQATDAQPTSNAQSTAEQSFEVGKPDKAEMTAKIGEEVSFTFEINDPNATAEDTYTVSFEDKAAEGVTPFDVSKIITAPATITGNDKKVTVTIPAELTKDIVAEEQHSLTYTVTKNGAEAVTVETPVKITFIAENVNSQDSDLTADNAADDAETMSDTSAVYSTHVQNIGWQSNVRNGQTAGTTGKAYRLEAMKIKLENQTVTGNIEYRTHIQNVGWESSWKRNGAMSGTSNRSLRLEAMQVRLTGSIANQYDVYYRVHAQNFGWLNWAKNGEEAGTEGLGYRLEAMQIVLVDKGGAAPSLKPDSQKDVAFVEQYKDNVKAGSLVAYQTHVQNVGWQNYAVDGGIAGTSGKALRLEGMKIYLNNPKYTGDIEYRTHIENIGWEKAWKKNDAMSGTNGKSLRLEAMQIRLTGEMAKHYDVYYRVHAENFGWLNWAKNGESAGTAGYGYRLEAMQIVLVAKGDDGSTIAPTIAPASEKDRAFTEKYKDNVKADSLIAYQTHVQNVGWQNYAVDGATSGTEGRKLRLEGMKMYLHNPQYKGDIEYRTHIENIGWESGWKKNDAMSGTSGRSLKLEAMQARLTGEMADHYDLYYRVSVPYFGWLGWAKNSESAGSTGMSIRIQAMQVVLVPKDGEAPGETSRPFLTVNDVKTSADIEYQGHVQDIGWMDWTKNGNHIGTMDRSLRLEAFQMKLSNQVDQNSGVSYQANVQDTGWQGWKNQNQIAGATGKAKRVECFQVQLTGEAAEVYDVYYHAYVQDYGWLGWAKNAEWAGTTGGSLRMEALSAVLVPKNQPAPGPTARHYIEQYPQANAVLNKIGRSLPAAFAWSVGMTYQNMATSPVQSCRAYADYGFKHYCGNCYVYASTFCEMAKAMGYKAYFVAGFVRLSHGLAPHGWVEIEEPDGLWVYDPEFQYQIGLNGYRVRYGQPNTWMYVGGHRVD